MRKWDAAILGFIMGLALLFFGAYRVFWGIESIEDSLTAHYARVGLLYLWLSFFILASFAGYVIYLLAKAKK